MILKNGTFKVILRIIALIFLEKVLVISLMRT
jgi:hypothetical protein